MGILLKLRKGYPQLGLLAYTLLFFTLLACTLPGRNASSPPPEDPWGVITVPKGSKAKIGLVAATTGPYSIMGKGMSNSVKMAIGDFKSSTGLAYELVEEDDVCQTDRALPLARNFAKQDGYVGIIGHMCTEATKAAIPVYTDAKIALLSPASTSPQITAMNSPVVFRTSWNDLAQIRPAANYAYNSLGLKGAAVIHDTTPYGSSLAEEFQRTYTGLGGSIILSRDVKFIEGTDSNVRELISILKDSNPSLIYFAGLGKNGVTLVKALREAGLNIPFMGPDSLNSKAGFIDPAGGASEGVYITYLSWPNGDKYDEWKAKYQVQFKTEVLGSGFERQSYDSAMVLMGAADKVAIKYGDGSVAIGKKALVDAIRSIEYEGLSGKVSFTDSGDRTEVTVEVARIVQGEIKRAN